MLFAMKVDIPGLSIAKLNSSLLPFIYMDVLGVIHASSNGDLLVCVGERTRGPYCCIKEATAGIVRLRAELEKANGNPLYNVARTGM
jgi:hypothetical protein